MAASDEPSIARVTCVGVLAWMLPGLGHIYLGQRRRGLVLLIVIAVTFWSGVAIGGVQSSVLPRTVDLAGQTSSGAAPRTRKAWFLAQIGAGSHTIAAYLWGEVRATSHPNERAHFVSEDVAIIYTGVAGLLNILIILDAIASCDPTYVRAGVRPPPRPTALDGGEQGRAA